MSSVPSPPDPSRRCAVVIWSQLRRPTRAPRHGRLTAPASTGDARRSLPTRAVAGYAPPVDIIRNSKDMQALSPGADPRALVPTMGNLHDGHVSLIRMAREHAPFVIVSLFVNPTQFGPGEDLARYPRTLDEDVARCRAEGVDILFAPDITDMYADNHSTYVVEEALASGHCGAARPGHFRGVCTVVARLFNLTRPSLAVFGEKDFQQLRVIERMVRDLAFPLSILRGPIIREEDGLAMSSRNRYLPASHRRQAAKLYAAIKATQRAFVKGVTDAGRLCETASAMLAQAPDARIEYVHLVEAETLESVTHATGHCRLLLAVRFGETRLIDNAALTA